MTTAIALNTSASGKDVGEPAPSRTDLKTEPGSDTRPQLKMAALNIYEAKPKKPGGSETGASLGSINFQFNPKELTIAKSAKWDRKPAKGATSAGPPEFTGADPCKLTLEMFFDTTAKHGGGVVASVEKLLSCCVPTKDTIGKKKAMPPLVVLHWGATTSFAGFVTSVSAKYTLFAADGTPIRALCSVAIEEMPDGLSKQNPTSGSISVRRVETVVAGDTLASMAYREYGDATMWRQLAAYNRIDDPLRLPTGTAVLLPPPEDLLVEVDR
jgi:hypothetical protein